MTWDPQQPHPLVCPAPGCELTPGHNGKHAKSEQDLLDGKGWVDLRPTTNKIEWQITYACDLACQVCNRASFLRKPHTPDMTIEDAEEYFRQAKEIEFDPFVVVIIGGEPTLHPQFEEFCKLARLNHRGEVWVISNGRTEECRRKLQDVRRRYSVSLHYDAFKTVSITKKNAPDHTQDWYRDMFVSPTDNGLPLREHCYTHASVLCGIAMDSRGYAPCALGGCVDAVLDLGVRTKCLADLFDKDRVAEMTAKLCTHCGYNLMRHNPDAMDNTVERFGTPLSPTWAEAFKDRK